MQGYATPFQELLNPDVFRAGSGGVGTSGSSPVLGLGFLWICSLLSVIGFTLEMKIERVNVTGVTE